MVDRKVNNDCLIGEKMREKRKEERKKWIGAY